MLREPEEDSEDEEDTNTANNGNGINANGKKQKLSVAFQIKANMVEVVKKTSH